MERYIGIDVHLQSCTVAVMDGRGKRLGEHRVETNGRALRTLLDTIAGTQHVVFEEGLCSEWLYELLSPRVEDLAVVQPTTKRRGSKSDSLDAWGLADGLRKESLGRPVFKAAGRLGALREAVRAYQHAVQDVVRCKNRLRALFASRGIAAGKELYDVESRPVRLKQLPAVQRQHATLLGQELDGLQAVRKSAESWLREEAGKVRTTALLATAPGIGEIRAAQIVATVVSPARFRTKRTFWSYCGLAVVTESSSDWEPAAGGQWRAKGRALTRGLNRNRHPLMKEVFKGAASSVLQRSPDASICGVYHRLVKAGTRESLARVTLARRIAAVVLALWKNQEVYDPERFVDRESSPRSSA
jgi:transposase